VICIKNNYGADYAQPKGGTSYIPYLCIKVYWNKALGILIYWLMLKCLIGKEMQIEYGEFKLGRIHEKLTVATWDVWNHISICVKTGENQHSLRPDGTKHEIKSNSICKCSEPTALKTYCLSVTRHMKHEICLYIYKPRSFFKKTLCCPIGNTMINKIVLNNT